MGTVAGAIVASKVARICNWYATKMCADAEHDEPLLALASHLVSLWITQLTYVHRLLGRNFVGGAMSHKEGLATPLEGHVLAFWDVGQLDFNLGQGQHVGRGAHRGDELCDDRLGAVGSASGGGCNGK